MSTWKIRTAILIFALTCCDVASATVITVNFPLYDGPSFTSAGPFPQPPTVVATQLFSIPAGEVVLSASVSGVWGTPTFSQSTAGVDVKINNAQVVQCVKPDAGCWVNGTPFRPWQNTNAVIPGLNAGTATLSVVQTSEQTIRLGATTLTITTGPPVPSLSPTALVALLIGLAVLGAAALGRPTV